MRREMGQATRHKSQSLRHRRVVANATHRGGGNTELKIAEPIIYDDYNGRIRADQDCIGTLTTNCGTDAPRNGVKIIEPQEDYIGCAVHPVSKKLEFDGYKDTDCPTLLATDNKCPKTVAFKTKKNYRVRKLTERECFRLMGVKSEDFERIAKNQSMSSLYHLAGDSIVTACLMAIFGLLLEVDYKQKITELTEELKEK